MNFSKIVCGICGIVISVSMAFGVVEAQGNNVVVDTSSVGSKFVAGSIVSVINEQIGDLFAAGESVSIDGIINGDVRGAGQSVVVNEQINDDARLAGRTVTVNAPIQGELRVASETATINAPVSLPTHIYSQTVRVNALLAPGSVIEGENVLISVPLQGPLTLNSSSVSFVGDGSIQGTVTTSSPSVQSTLTQAGSSVVFVESKRSEQSRENHRNSFPRFSIFCIALFSWIVLRYLPNYITRTSSILKDTIAKSFWLGAAILIGSPIIALLLLITVVGAPVAGVLIMLWIALIVFLKVLIVSIGTELLGVYYPYVKKTSWHTLLVILLSSILIVFLPGMLLFVLGCFVVGAGCQQDWKILKEIA